MAQQSDWVDIPAESNEWVDVPAKKTPSRAAGPGPIEQAPYVPPKGQEREDFSLIPDIPWVTVAPEFIRKGARSLADYLTTPRTRPNELTSEAIAAGGVMHPNAPKIKTEASPLAAFTAGALEGAAEQVNLLNIGTAALGGGEVAAVRSAERLSKLGKVNEARKALGTAKKLETATKVASLPVIGQGAENITDPEASLGERAMGVAQLAGGLLGLRSRVGRVSDIMEANPTVLGGLADDIDLSPTGEGVFQTSEINSTVAANKEMVISRPTEVRANSITVKPGPSAPSVINDLLSKGYRIEGGDDRGIRMVRDQDIVGPQEITPEVNKFGIPQDRMFAADKVVPESRVEELTKKFADMSTTRTFPDTGESQYSEMLKKLGGTQEDAEFDVDLTVPPNPPEEPSFSRIPDDYNETMDALGHTVDPNDPLAEQITDIRNMDEARVNQVRDQLYQQLQDRNYHKNNADTLEDLQQLWDEARDRSNFLKNKRENTEPSFSKMPEERSGLEQQIDNLSRQIAEAQTGLKPAAEEQIAAWQAERQELEQRLSRTLVGKSPIESPYTDQEFVDLDVEGPAMQRDPNETPEQLAVRKKKIATDWYYARRKAKELGINDKLYRHLSDLKAAIEQKYGETFPEEPEFSSNLHNEETVGIDIGDPQEMVKIFRNTYGDNIAPTAMKELLQNAIDATSGDPNGQIEVTIDKKDKFIIITDNGPGLTKEQMVDLYLKLSASGKRGSGKKTIGELGVGKTTYLMGGENIYVESTALNKDGQLMTTTIQGTPEEFLAKTVVIRERPAGEGVPTGIGVQLKLAEDANMGKADDYLDNYKNYSDAPTPIKINRISQSGFKWTTQIDRKNYVPGNKLLSGTTTGTDYTISIPSDANVGESSSIAIIINNRGMFQGAYDIWVQKGIYPDRLVLELDPTVPGDHKDYPLVAPTRERLKDNLRQTITKEVENRLVKKGIQDRISALSQAFQDMQKTKTRQKTAVIYDPSERLARDEMIQMMNSYSLQDLADAMQITLQILQKLTPSDKINKARNDVFGFLFEDKVAGVNFKDPKDKGALNYAILLNPFESMITREDVAGQNVYLSVDPQMAARRMVHTIIHEFTHNGAREEGAGFTWLLGEIYGYFPLDQQIGVQDAILDAIADPNTGEYNGEIQDLLQVYIKSRGRGSSKKDLLMGERGIGSFAESLGPSAIRTGDSANGSGTAPKSGPELKRFSMKESTRSTRKAALDAGFAPTGFSDKAGNPLWEKTPTPELNLFREIWNLPRGLMSVDLPFLTSAALRQGLPLIGPNFAGWVKSWGSAAKAYGAEHAYAEVMNSIARDPLFRRTKVGKEWQPSMAEMAGLDLSDVKNMMKREEVIKSQWAEKIPVWGRHVAASNRAYTAFLNTLRASSFRRFMEQAKENALTDNKPEMDPYQNIEVAKRIAETINVLTGRGKLELEILPKTNKYPGRKYSLEGMAKILTDHVFSPRLQASRVKMLNPISYMSMNDIDRQLLLKGLLAAVGTWWVIDSLLELNGAEVSKDPNNADFGKAKFGNTRVDPGSGFQQFIVLGSRLRPSWLKSPVDVPTPPYGDFVTDPGGGLFTSSTSNETRPLGVGFRAKTRGEVFQDFASSKLHPSTKLIYDIMFANDSKKVYLGDRLLQLAVPMMVGDLAEVYEQDPNMLPLVIGAGSIGMGANTYEGGPQKPSLTPILEQLTGTSIQDRDITFP